MADPGHRVRTDATKFIIGYAVAIPACALCISRRLYIITSGQRLAVTPPQKRRALCEDLLIGVGIPVLNMILRALFTVLAVEDANPLSDYIPQGHRFNILENIGCFPSTYNTWVAFFLVHYWPLAIGMMSGAYCVMNLILIRRLSRSAGNLASETGDRHNSLNRLRFLRLTTLASADILITIPISAWVISLNLSTPIHPWISWEDTHKNFSRVNLIPYALWQQNAALVDSNRWLVVVTAFVFFGIFGTSKDVIRANLDLVRGTWSYLRAIRERRRGSYLPHHVIPVPFLGVESFVLDISPTTDRRDSIDSEASEDLEKRSCFTLSPPPAYEYTTGSNQVPPVPKLPTLPSPVRLLPPIPLHPRRC
ncbi:a-factor receptor [Marasmius tenuissimus]|nr:a-factor receptor [Marasmius tenuissimus]